MAAARVRRARNGGWGEAVLAKARMHAVLRFLCAIHVREQDRRVGGRRSCSGFGSSLSDSVGTRCNLYVTCINVERKALAALSRSYCRIQKCPVRNLTFAAKCSVTIDG